MKIPVLRWPLHTVPVIRTAGRFPLDERDFETTYRHVTHALHLHDYAGSIHMDSHRFALRPGDLTLSRAGGRTRYDLPVPGHHWCIHFQPAAVRGGKTVLPWHVRAGTHRGYLTNRMAEIARLHNQSRHPLALARAATLLQDLLLWVAALAATDRPARRSDIALDRLLALLDERFAEPWTVPELAKAIGLTQDYMARCFRQRVGLTIPRYLLQRRIAHARQLLVTTDLPVNRIAARVGMRDAQHFNKQFRRLTGLSPTAARGCPTGGQGLGHSMPPEQQAWV